MSALIIPERGVGGSRDVLYLLSWVALQIQDRSRLSTNHRRRWRDRSRPVLHCNAPLMSSCLFSPTHLRIVLILNDIQRNATQLQWEFRTQLWACMPHLDDTNVFLYSETYATHCTILLLPVLLNPDWFLSIIYLFSFYDEIFWGRGRNRNNFVVRKFTSLC